MTRIHFLHSAPDRIQAAAAWIAAARERRQPVTVYAPRNDLADRLDRQLWIVPAIGFIPHCRGTSALAGETPIVITGEVDPSVQHQCLLNLSDDTPPAFASFDTLVEIVSTEDAVRLPARERAKFYKERGYEVQFQDIGHGH